MRDGLFTNWKFGFDSDPRLHDLPPSCTWAFPLLILGVSKLNKPLPPPPSPSNGLEKNKLPGRGLIGELRYVEFIFTSVHFIQIFNKEIGTGTKCPFKSDLHLI